MLKHPLSLFLFVVIAMVSLTGCNRASAASAPLPKPAVDENAATAKGKETAVFAGGCFWGVQAVFQHVKGVINATSGYAGGAAKTAEYETVSTGTTGHAESVQVVYDPAQVSYGQLLQVFFSVAHDPTELNRRCLHRATCRREGVSADDCHPGRAATGVLCGRGVSPELRHASPEQSIHRY
jgi:peptide-methionine (S)-S-oxide reductase